MSSSVVRTLNISGSNYSNYIVKNGGNIQIGGSSYGYSQIACVTSGKSGTVKLTDAAKAVLYPNSSAHPTNISISFPFQVNVTTGTIQFQIDGSTLLSDSLKATTDARKTSTGSSSDSYVTNSSKNSNFILSYSKSASLIGYCGTPAENTISISATFTRYDFSASAGTGIASASVSSSTGFNGDAITYSATVQQGYNFDGWYNGASKVSSSTSYSLTVAGTDIALTAKASRIITDATVSVSYNGSTITSYTTQSFPITVKFTNGANITTVDVGQTKTLTCKNKIPRDNITVGTKTLTCKDNKMADNITISVT